MFSLEKNFKYLVIIITILLFVGIVIAIGQSSSDEIKQKQNMLQSLETEQEAIIRKHVEMLNSRCPISMNELETIFSVILDKENRNIIYKGSCNVKDTWANIEKKMKDFTYYGALYQYVIMGGVSKENDDYIDSCIKEGYSFVFDMGGEHQIIIDSKLYTEVKETAKNDSIKAANHLLDMYIKIQNENLPQFIDEDDIFVSLSKDVKQNNNQYLTYTFKIIDDELWHEAIQSKIELRDSYRRDLESNPAYNGALVICNKLRMGFCFKFINNEEDNFFELYFKYDDYLIKLAEKAFDKLNSIPKI